VVTTTTESCQVTASRRSSAERKMKKAITYRMRAAHEAVLTESRELCAA
jgi:hypothetical protein